MRPASPVPILLIALLLALPPTRADAQQVGGELVFHSLSVGDEIDLRQVAFPLGVTHRFGAIRVDANTAVAHARLEDEQAASELSGMTDILVRVLIPVFGDRARLIAAGNIPTGSETLMEDEVAVAAALTTDLFTLPVTSFGSGAGFTGGISYAQPFGSWVVGGVATYRVGASYDPLVSTAAGTTSDFRPGDEFRVRLAVERPSAGGATLRFAGSWSRFGEDQTEGTDFFDRGDRFVGEAMVEFPFGRGSAVVYAWDLHRSAGRTTADFRDRVTIAGSRNLIGAGGRLFLPVGATTTLRPVAEVLGQTAEDVGETGLGNGYLLRAGTGIAFRLGRLTFEPAVLAQFGELDDDTITGVVIRGGVVLSR